MCALNESSISVDCLNNKKYITKFKYIVGSIFLGKVVLLRSLTKVQYIYFENDCKQNDSKKNKNRDATITEIFLFFLTQV